MMTKLVIFDFDGVIAETEPLQLDSYNKLLSHFAKPSINKEIFVEKYIGHPASHILARMREEFEINQPLEQLQKLKDSYYNDSINFCDLSPRTGLNNLLDQLKSFGWELAIASSSKKSCLSSILNRLQFEHYFENKKVFTTENVKNGKPSPDIYNFAVESLSCPKDRVIAIEDSATGLTSAKSAGLKCIVIPNDFTKNQDFHQADLLINDFSEVSHETLSRLITN